jgi:hypothetical protein
MLTPEMHSGCVGFKKPRMDANQESATSHHSRSLASIRGPILFAGCVQIPAFPKIPSGTEKIPVMKVMKVVSDYTFAQKPGTIGV